VELLLTVFDFVLHLDRHLGALVRDYGPWIYVILFLIVFCETGLVVTPFLPGDSLLFVAGTLAALGGINVHLLVVLLAVAAISGNTCNYAVGRFLGPRLFKDRQSRWLNPEYLERTHAFYEKYGGIAVVISRFVPIIRTYVPFVAGLGAMSYGKFTVYNVFGALTWVLSITYLGYFFGNIPWIKERQGVIIIGIVLVSVVPVVIGFFKARSAPDKTQIQ
jgi:membrane-associated protein